MKTIKTFAFAVLALAMSFATTSCSKDDAGTASVSTTKIETPSQSQSQQESTKSQPMMKISYDLSEDMFNLYDMTLTYTDGTGELKTETIKQEDGTKKEEVKAGGTYSTNVYYYNKLITFTKMPISSVQYKISLKLKDTPLAKKESYTMIYNINEENTTSAKMYIRSSGVWNVKDIQELDEDIQDYFKANAGNYTLGADGKFTAASTRGLI